MEEYEDIEIILGQYVMTFWGICEGYMVIGNKEDGPRTIFNRFYPSSHGGFDSKGGNREIILTGEGFLDGEIRGDFIEDAQKALYERAVERGRYLSRTLLGDRVLPLIDSTKFAD